MTELEDKPGPPPDINLGNLLRPWDGKGAFPKRPYPVQL